MKSELLISALLCLAAPTLAQTDAGTPPASSGPTAGIPQRLALPPSGPSGALQTGKKRYPVGAAIPLTFTVKNGGKKDLHYDFNTGQQIEITAADAKGATVWTWSHGRMFPQMVTHFKLRPGEKKTFTAQWNGADDRGRPVAPGVYTLNARLTSNDRPAVTGSLVINPDTDPENIGVPTRSPAETGAVRNVHTNPPVTASATVRLTAPEAK